MPPRKRQRAVRGTGSVGFDKVRGKWYARVYVPTGTARRVSHRSWAATEAEAEEARTRLLAQYGLDGGEAADAHPATLGEYLEEWIAAHGRAVRASTRRSYADHIDLHIVPLLGGIPLYRLRTRDVDRLIADRLKARKSPATVVRIITTLRMALTDAQRRRLVTDNVARYASLPRVEVPYVVPMTEDEAARITEAVAGTWIADIVVLLLGSGLRIGEACGLDWGDIHEDEGFVVVRVTKTRQRAVAISDDAADMLRRKRQARVVVSASAPVFERERRGRGAREDDMRMRQSSVTHALPKLLEAAGLRKVSPHGLRHGAATILVSQGVHMRVIAEQLGHKDGGALAGKRYAHVVPGHLVSAAQKLNRRRA